MLQEIAMARKCVPFCGNQNVIIMFQIPHLIYSLSYPPYIQSVQTAKYARMSKPTIAFLAMLVLSRIGVSAALSCLQRASDISLAELGSNSAPLPSGSQAIVTSYKFACCGEITSWLAYVWPSGEGLGDGIYTILFQVWRPSPTADGGGCYSLVGENRFPGVTLGDGGLVSETPQPTNLISVRPGDVLGYFVSSNKRPSLNGGIQLDQSSTNDTVFYASADTTPLPIGPDSCPVSVGPGGVLSSSINAAPVISVNISKLQKCSWL